MNTNDRRTISRLMLFFTVSCQLVGTAGCKGSGKPKAAEPAAAVQGTSPGDVMTPPPASQGMVP